MFLNLFTPQHICLVQLCLLTNLRVRLDTSSHEAYLCSVRQLSHRTNVGVAFEQCIGLHPNKRFTPEWTEWFPSGAAGAARSRGCADKRNI